MVMEVVEVVEVRVCGVLAGGCRYGLTRHCRFAGRCSNGHLVRFRTLSPGQLVATLVGYLGGTWALGICTFSC